MFQLKKGERGFFQLFYQDKPLHSLINPEKEADNILLKNIVPEDDVIIIVGIGLGYLLKSAIQYQKQYQRPINIKAVFLSEKEQAFFDQASILNDSEKSKIQFLMYDSREAIHFLIQEIVASNGVVQKIGWVFSLALIRHFEVEKNIFMKIFNQNLRYQTQTLSTRLEFMHLWNRNTLMNLQWERHKQIDLRFQGDVLLIAAGNSLIKNLSFVQSLKGKIPLIAVDTALRPLYEYGIVPDMVVSCDAQIYNQEHFFYMMNYHYRNPEIEKPFLIADITHYSSITRFFDQVIFAQTPDMSQILLKYCCLEEQMAFLKILEAGGSVASFAVSFAYHFGASRIVFVGQDLGYDYLSHSRSTVQHYRFLFNADRLHPFWNPYKKDIRLNKEKPFQSYMLQNLTAWLQEFFAFYPQFQGIQKDPFIEIKGISLFQSQDLKTLNGHFLIQKVKSPYLDDAHFHEKINMLKNILFQLRQSKDINELMALRQKFLPEEQILLNNLFLKMDLYQTRHKSVNEQLYIGGIFHIIDDLLRVLQKKQYLII